MIAGQARGEVDRHCSRGGGWLAAGRRGVSGLYVHICVENFFKSLKFMTKRYFFMTSLKKDKA